MSESQLSPTTEIPHPKILRPRWFLIGLALGLLLMAFAGWQAGQIDFHPGFGRFHPAISPETNYYPSIDEMVAIVRARCRPDQILVIVGGNSVLQGVAQPEKVMWSRKLQEDLGDGYCVINFAFRGVSPVGGGAIIAEMLRNAYPRQIYIANEKPVTEIPAIGNETYRFIFWQAYLAGKLLPAPAREKAAWKFLRAPNLAFAAPDFVVSAWLDRLLHFQVFWNRVAFTKLNTVSSFFAPAPPAMFRPRRLFPDNEPDGGAIPVERRYPAGSYEIEMKILRATTDISYAQAADGAWVLKPDFRNHTEQSYREAFPIELQARTLMLVGRDSVFYRRDLTAAERARDEQAVNEAVELFKACGYDALDYGRDFVVADYHDRTHLTASGGAKLAERVAPEVRALAARLGYLSR